MKRANPEEIGFFYFFGVFLFFKGGEKVSVLHKHKKTIIFCSVLLLAASVLLFLVHPIDALAADPKDAWSKAGIKKSSSIDATGIYKDFDKIIMIIFTVAGFWIIGCIIFASMMLTGSQGNPQKRSMGIAGICLAMVGGFVCFKAYDIAGWIASMGA